MQLGSLLFAFRGHNLILEIQATMPSSAKHPSHVPMWRGVNVSYTLIAVCLFPPLAIGGLLGLWSLGYQQMEGCLQALYEYHSKDVSQSILGLTELVCGDKCSVAHSKSMACNV
ncbi:hypothetical protein GBA52_025324 [Prunus armeniaca]|nr:hypothetical protein GBA52_025324 [Prunus armeniaca]